MSALLLLAALLDVPRVSELPGQASTAAFLSRRSRPKVLYTFQDNQLILSSSKFLNLPTLGIRKIPPRPLAFGGLSTSVDSTLDRDIMGFPFTTPLAGSLQLGFPRWAGSIQLSAQDPPKGAESEDAHRTAEATYRQSTAGLGNVTASVKSTGEWNAGFVRKVEDLGQLQGTVNSQLDWSLDLDSTYPAIWGFVPSTTYGATQEGMRVRTTFDGMLHKNLGASYTVENQPGKYSPADLTHNGQLTLSSSGGKGRARHVLEAQGTFDRKLPSFPARGSLAYRAETRPITLEASVDAARYRLRAFNRYGQVAAAVGRKAEESGRPAELEVRAGKVSAVAVTDGQQPRIRVSVAL